MLVTEDEGTVLVVVWMLVASAVLVHLAMVVALTILLLVIWLRAKTTRPLKTNLNLRFSVLTVRRLCS